jgi:hypothetical protein
MVYQFLVRHLPACVAEVLAVMCYAVMAALIVYYFFEPQASFSYLKL